MKRNKKLIVTIAMLAATILVTGCATPMSGGIYQRDQALRAQQVMLGKVVALQHVKIGGPRTGGAGTLIGAVAGTTLGSRLGGDTARDLGAIVGMVGGGIAGKMASDRINEGPGYAITVQTDQGNMLAVTQAADFPLNVGDAVQVLMDGGTARVLPL